jgi:hypothetical protein
MSVDLLELFRSMGLFAKFIVGVLAIMSISTNHKRTKN